MPPEESPATPKGRRGGDATEAAGGVTIRQLLAVPELGLTLLSGTGRIDQPLRWAHPTELLDPRPYLKGGELVLTVGASLSQDVDRCRAYVDRLVYAKVSAIGYGVGDVTEEVPQGLVDACRHHHMPLLRVPAGVPFQAITTFLADRRADTQTANERRVRHLSARLLDAMAADCSLQDLLEIIRADLGGRLRYDGGILEWEPAAEGDVTPAASTLRHLASVVAVRQHEHDVASAQQRAEVGRLIHLVLTGKADTDALRDALRRADVNAGSPLLVAAWPPKVATLVAPRLGASLFADLGTESLSVTAPNSPVLDVAIQSAVPCGVAAPCELSGLAGAVTTAIAALDLSRKRGAPATHRDLVTFQGLLEQQPGDRIQPFAQSLLAPLVEHDREHGSALVATLRAFLEADGSVNSTARHLHLHPNSLRHRLKRIAELAGSDPRVFADRVALAVGLWAWDRRPRGRR